MQLSFRPCGLASQPLQPHHHHHHRVLSHVITLHSGAVYTSAC